MKFQPSHRRTAVVFCCGFLLHLLLIQANHSLSGWNLSIWLGGLVVAFPALRLAPQQGFNSCFLLGLLFDAHCPLPFGTLAFLFSVAHLIIVRVRNRFAAAEPLIATIVALITNLVLYVVTTSIVLADVGGTTVSGLRLLSDLILSQLCIALIAPWYFALQERALIFARIGLHDEPVTAI